jgi:hypothetical protein
MTNMGRSLVVHVRGCFADGTLGQPGGSRTTSTGPLENDMTKTIACAVMATSLLAFTATADAKGCIKGAIIGGIAGHLAGHGAVGAAAGCAIGHHEANKPSNPQPSTTGSAPQSARR